MRKVFVDTNVLLNEKFDFSNFEAVHISIISIEELDDLKSEYRARAAIRKIMDAKNATIHTVPFYRDMTKNDNTILDSVRKICGENGDIAFLTDDYALYLKARSFNVNCRMFDFAKKEIYRGWRYVDLNEIELAEVYENMDKNIFELYTNEYVIIKLGGVIKDRLRWNGKKLVKLKTFKFRGKIETEVMKPLDDIQACAYDAVLNPKVEVVCLTGKSGTGKTKTALSLSLEMLKTEEYTRIVFVRHALETSSSVGYLPGDLLDKMEPYTKCLSDNLNSSMNTLEDYIDSKKIEVTSLSLLKGRNFDNNAIIIFDECEDAYPEHIELVGTRQCGGSKTIFVGDYDQVSNSKYRNNSGLLKLIQKAKGKDWFSCVELQKNGRGKVAEFFATEFKM